MTERTPPLPFAAGDLVTRGMFGNRYVVQWIRWPGELDGKCAPRVFVMGIHLARKDGKPDKRANGETVYAKAGEFQAVRRGRGLRAL